MLKVAAEKKVKVSYFDIKTAFLYGELEEEIYMVQPQGFVDDPSLVYKLKRSIYGLKQTARCWNKKLAY